MTPVFALYFGRLLNAFFAADFQDEINKFVLIILYIACGAFVAGEQRYGC